MQQIAAVRSLKQASRVIKQMEHQSPEWMPDLRELGRKALRRVLQEHMQRQVRRYLAEAARQGVADRRNGSYPRQLLTALGDLELCVPRTRRFSALVESDGEGQSADFRTPVTGLAFKALSAWTEAQSGLVALRGFEPRSDG